MYIAIEGVDCSGKSTQISFLKEAFPDAIFTREPGATKIGETLRDIVLNNKDISDNTRFLLFLADRAEHTQKVIKPALLSNKKVVSDRSFISGMAYHLSNYPNSSIEEIFALNKFATDNNLPDKVIFLNITQDELAKRLNSKTQDAIELKGIDYMLNVQGNIKKSLEYTKIEFLEINAKESPENIYLKIMDFI